MTRQEKAQVIAELTEKLASTPNFYVTNTGGLSVAEINSFRKLCYSKSLEYKMYKNTLIVKALENQEGDFTALYDVLKGTSGIIFGQEDAKAPAKTILEFKKSAGDDKIAFKGASIGGDLFIGEDQLKALEKIKSKEEVIGEVITLLQSPAKNVVSALQSGKNTLAGLVKALEERAQ
jgi:large subunit ribosomal protein L10